MWLEGGGGASAGEGLPEHPRRLYQNHKLAPKTQIGALIRELVVYPARGRINALVLIAIRTLRETFVNCSEQATPF